MPDFDESVYFGWAEKNERGGLNLFDNFEERFEAKRKFYEENPEYDELGD